MSLDSTTVKLARLQSEALCKMPMSSESNMPNQNLTLTDISIYPIKSTTGISIDRSHVSPWGLDYDRNLMLVDDEGVFISQRKYPRMALIKTRLIKQRLSISAPGLPEIEFELKDNTDFANSIFQPESVQVEVWKTECYGHVANETINQWFSQFLNMSVRLVHYDHQKPRVTAPEYSQPGDIVSFADGFPLLVISHASLNDLNSRLATLVSMKNFRPNIVIDGCAPYAEDDWKQIRVGEVVFDAVKRCSRCVLTTVNPTTGEKREDKEPLKTLSQYRRGPGGVYIGMNLIPRTRGIIRKGDSVELLS
ncbi:MOSC domain-containing protein [Aliikangiella coralliicola]|uniref:MOSC domain-containing protein n=1 Tax=Aliikangiella coralliicola TaxID=2592383 RepID=A0A545U7F5_9GAMM|nr:MOSC domain-containing protein [Aliikangiella coralliicola]TQV85395.1 MOSC domain-containing protein [Aliikangiella coralliicola]